MTTDPTPVDRIPLTRSVHYVARGLPEVPNQYGPGVLAPSEITLTYRAAPDSQLGRVHAYVAGRIWVDGKELPLLPGGLYGQHYMDGLDNWPAWLAEEARLHDPERTAPAGLGVSATPSHTDRGAVSATLWATAEHHTVAEWICCDPINPDHALCAQGGAALRMLQALLVDDPEAWKPAPLLDDVMRLLPPAGSVAESHRLAMSQALDLGTGAPWDAIHERVQELRRLADEAQQQPTDRDVVEAHDAALSFTLKANEAPRPEPSVHGESVAHLAGLHDDEHAVDARQPDGAHVCKPGASRYYCPTSGQTESDCHGGFNICCDRPDLHEPAVDARQDGAPS